MKLTRAQADQVRENLDLDAIDESQDIQSDLESVLGEHTFFINDNGLFIFREQPKQDGANDQARLLVVAAWTNDDNKDLKPIDPPSEVDVVFDLVDGKIIGGK